MAATNERFPRLGINIKRLREARGETQADLAYNIGLTNECRQVKKSGDEKGDSRSTISNYETGKRIPERDILIRMAKHFGVTENELLYGDFSGMAKITNLPINNLEYTKIILEKMFPLVCTPAALENQSFQKAYKLHTDFFTGLFTSSDFDLEKIDQCIVLYEIARKDDIVEAAANHLSCLMLYGYLIVFMTPRMLENFEIYEESQLSTKIILDSLLPSFDEDSTPEDFDTSADRDAFLADNESAILLDLFILRKSRKYRDLGDYYLAFRHTYNLLRNSLTSEMNFTVGAEMFLTFSRLKNKYCKDFLNLLKT